MKGFLRSKLVLTLATFIMIAAAGVIPLSGSIGRAHAQNSVPIPFSTINGAFFPNPSNGGTFDVNPSTTPDFTQSFPIVAFNPPSNLQNCSNSTGVGETTVPFTDVVPNPDGSCSTVIAQGNGEQAGVAPLVAFETVFTATLTVPSAGTLSSNILSDDGWIFSVGPNSNGTQPTPVTGNIMTNPPAGNKSPFKGYPEMGDNNTISGPTPFTIGVNFPAAGTYPVELDYTECCNNGSPNGVLALVVSNSFTPTPAPQLIQLSSDPYTNSTSQHKTEVEPDTFSFGSTIVSAFQVSRFANLGGSDNIGWATSTDNGTTWQSGLLSGITKIAGGTYDRASDPSVAYDAAHKTWMIVSIGVVIHGGIVAGSAVLVSRSSDGLTWNAPVRVGSGEFFDKPWIVCDNTASSPYYGHCYIEWDDGAEIAGNLIVMATSTNGGTKWVQTLTANKARGLGGQALVQPNGTVIVPFLRTFLTSSEQDIAAFISTTGGTSWSNTVTIAVAKMHPVRGNFRSDLPLPSAEIDGSGKVYVVWSDCQLEPNCAANDIVMSSSTNGTTWSTPPKPISPDPMGSGVDHFIPGIAVDQSTSGGTAHLALAFYYYPVASCSTDCLLDVGFTSSTNGGGNWTAKTQLAGPMTLTWLAQAPTIAPSSCSPNCWMVGDYISTSFSGGKAYPVFAVATAPSGGLLNEAMYTVVGGLS